MSDLKVTFDGPRIAVVGGGITGLFCAYTLLKQTEHGVDLFESTNRIGGRIRTIRLDQQQNEIKGHGLDLGRGHAPGDKLNGLEFYAEFGPMRLELDRQPLLSALLKLLEIGEVKPNQAGEDKPHLAPFPNYSSPASDMDPSFELRPEEQNKTPLELLKLALLRVVLDLECISTNVPPFFTKRNELMRAITLATATFQPVDGIFSEWLNDLTEADYWAIQATSKIHKIPLYALGFWNLLSHYLSHHAILKIRDYGTFYHLIVENPNAAEWLVWWMRGLGSKEGLTGIRGGMESIIEYMYEKLLKEFAGDERLRIHKHAMVAKLELEANKVKIECIPDEKAEDVIPPDPKTRYDRVILAIPKSPLKKLSIASPEIFGQQKNVGEYISASFGFPMVKIFIIVKERWWESKRMANQNATRMPTRELHYWAGLSKLNAMVDSRQGMVMLYTDRPASSFWANYVAPGEQEDVHRGKKGSDETSPKEPDELPKALARRLKTKVVEFLNLSSGFDLKVDDVLWYGIRDWGRDPFVGANHAWRPERKFWVAMAALADIPCTAEEGTPRLHVCGEAYSDYHGFIEGSLRSACYTLHRILAKQKPKWLDDILKRKNAHAEAPDSLVECLDSLAVWFEVMEASREHQDGWKYNGEDAKPDELANTIGEILSASKNQSRAP